MIYIQARGGRDKNVGMCGPNCVIRGEFIGNCIQVNHMTSNRYVHQRYLHSLAITVLILAKAYCPRSISFPDPSSDPDPLSDPDLLDTVTRSLKLVLSSIEEDTGFKEPT